MDGRAPGPAVIARGSQRHKAKGMTLLEVLIAVMLFAVFTGVMTMVTELMAAMMSSDQKTTAATECGSPPLDRICIDLVLDDLTVTLQSPTFSVSNLQKSLLEECKPTAGELLKLDFDQIPASSWPTGYDFCIYSYGAKNSSFIEDLSAGRPGLYLLHAQPTSRSPLKQPVQRLVCRPRTLCA